MSLSSQMTSESIQLFAGHTSVTNTHTQTMEHAASVAVDCIYAILKTTMYAHFN